MIPLGIYTRYDRKGASSRLRYYSYIDSLKESGFDVKIHPLFSDRYLEQLYSGSSFKMTAARDMAERIFQMPPAEEFLWIEYELLPKIPYFAEKLFLGKKKYILGFDDAVFLNYKNKFLLDGKYERLAANAAGIMAGNDMLLEYFSHFNQNTVKIPTAVDTDAITPSKEKFPIFTLAWIGTPVTYKAHLEPLLPILSGIMQEINGNIIAIGAPSDVAVCDMPWLKALPWSEETEREILPKCHAGIMPLPENDQFAAGKSAFKLLQYLAAGIPAVASPIGENKSVVKAGETGFFASSPNEWMDAVKLLSSDKILCRSMGENSRMESEKYSVRLFSKIIGNFFKKTFLHS